MGLKGIYIAMIQLSVIIYVIYMIRNIIVLGILKTEAQMTNEEIEEETKEFPQKLIEFIFVLKKYPILLLILNFIICFIPFFNIILAISELQTILGME